VRGRAGGAGRAQKRLPGASPWLRDPPRLRPERVVRAKWGWRWNAHNAAAATIAAVGCRAHKRGAESTGPSVWRSRSASFSSSLCPSLSFSPESSFSILARARLSLSGLNPSLPFSLGSSFSSSSFSLRSSFTFSAGLFFVFLLRLVFLSLQARPSLSRLLVLLFLACSSFSFSPARLSRSRLLVFLSLRLEPWLLFSLVRLSLLYARDSSFSFSRASLIFLFLPKLTLLLEPSKLHSINVVDSKRLVI
jgi:hypothetical protein